MILLLGTTSRQSSRVRRLQSRQLIEVTIPCCPPASSIQSPTQKSSESCNSNPEIRSLRASWEAKPSTAVSTAEVVTRLRRSRRAPWWRITAAARAEPPKLSNCTSSSGGSRHQPKPAGNSTASQISTRMAATATSRSSARDNQRRWAKGRLSSGRLATSPQTNPASRGNRIGGGGSWRCWQKSLMPSTRPARTTTHNQICSRAMTIGMTPP